MSSSRIIKGEKKEKQLISDYAYEALQEEGWSQLPPPTELFEHLFSINPGLMNESGRPDTSGRFPGEDPCGDNPGPGAKELQRLLQDSCDKGFADGRREAEESFTAVCQTLSEALIAVSELRLRIFRESEDDLLRLAISVSKQIVRREISQDRTILAQFISDATTGINDQNDVIISFHPEDYRLVSANRQLYLGGIGDKMQITIKPDDSVTLGGCIADTQTGLVDAQVETQLAEIFKRLMEERGHGRDEKLELISEEELYPVKKSGGENYAYKKD